MKSSLIAILAFANSILTADVEISRDLPLSTATVPVPTPKPEPTNPTETTTSTSSTPTNCYIDGPCDCDEDDPDYFQCITNPNCRECFINDRTLTPRTSMQSASKARSSSASISANSDGLPDNCWIGGPCDCSPLEQYSDRWYQCIGNPACTHCHTGDVTLTPRSSTVPITLLPSSISSSAEADTTTNFETMAPGTYTATSSGTVVIIIVTDKAASQTGEPVSTVGKDVPTRTTVVVQSLA